MREIQRMMGLTDSIMWISWIIQRAFIILFCSSINTIGLVVRLVIRCVAKIGHTSSVILIVKHSNLHGLVTSVPKNLAQSVGNLSVNIY